MMVPNTFFGTSRSALIRATELMEQDMHLLGDEQARAMSYLKEIFDVSTGSESVHDYFQHLGVRSRSIVYGEYISVDSTALQTKFGRMILAANRLPNLGSAAVMESQCNETEPRLFRSLSLHTASTVLNRRKSSPALILMKDSQPIGYQKSSGQPVTYFWDSVELQTAHGPRSIQGDNFGFIDPSEVLWRRLDETDAGLLAVNVTANLINDAGMLRSSTHCYPKAARVAMAYSAADMSPILEAHIDQSVSFDPCSIAQKVGILLDTFQIQTIR